jgi:hypothetical protein
MDSFSEPVFIDCSFFSIDEKNEPKKNLDSTNALHRAAPAPTCAVDQPANKYLIVNLQKMMIWPTEKHN